jgi:phage terminase large subunit-like protein
MRYNKAAREAIDFVELLTLVGDKSGEPVKLLPFQKDILAVLFGNRDVKRALIFLPRKQAKTFIVACIVLYWLLGRGLKGQQCLSIANDREQAGLLFNMCRQMVEAESELSDVCEIVPSVKRLTVPASHSFYSALSTESTTKTGFNPSLVIVDEAQDIQDADLIKNITTGRTNREDYLTLFVGTAGKRKDTPFYKEYEMAKQWKADKEAGRPYNKNYYAWIYEGTEEDEADGVWDSPKVWKRVMPAYGHFCKPSSVEEEAALGRAMPHKKDDFLQYMLNRWRIYAGSKWVSDVQWMANAEPPLHDAKYYFAGFDPASVEDTTSLTLFGKNSRGTWDVIPFVWVCREQVNRRDLKGQADFNYKQWERSGHLRVTEGSSQDLEAIANQIDEIAKTYPIKQIAIDPTGTNWIAQRFIHAGLNPVEFKQDIRTQTEPIKELWKLIDGKKLRHGGHPVLRWMANNIKTVTDGKENIVFHKGHSDDKIDGMAALANAVGIALPTLAAEQFNTGRSVYEERGLLVF